MTPPIKETTGVTIRGTQPLMIARPDMKVTSGSATSKYAELTLNPVVKTALDQVLIGTFWSHFQIQSYNQNDLYNGLDNIIRKEVEDAFERVGPDSFTNILRNILYDALVFGFAIAEYTWEQNGCLRFIKCKTPSDFDIVTDEFLNVVGYNYNKIGLQIRGDDTKRFMLATYPHLIDGNWYGKSELQNIYHDVKLLEVVEEAQTRGIKLLSIRPLLHWYKAGERTQEEIDTIQKALFTLDAGALISIPMESDPTKSEFIKNDIVEVLEDRSSGQGVALITDVINLLQKRIMRAIGIPDNLGYTDTNIGSLAKAREEMDMFTSRLIRNQEFLISIVNRQIIPAIVKYRFPFLPMDYRLPKIVFETIEEEYLKKVSEHLKEIISAGIVDPKEEWIRDLLDIPKPTEKRKRKFLQWL